MTCPEEKPLSDEGGFVVGESTYCSQRLQGDNATEGTNPLTDRNVGDDGKSILPTNDALFAIYLENTRVGWDTFGNERVETRRY